MTKLDSILKSRGITLPTKVHLIKAMVFPVVMYGCECCIIKKAEQWRIDGFKQGWCRRLLRVPWTARRSDQSILKKISPEYSLELLMLELKLCINALAIWCNELTHWKRPWCWEKLKAKGEESRGWNNITDLMDMNLSKLWELVIVKEACHASVCLIEELDMTEWLNWTPWWLSGKEYTCQCRKCKICKFNPFVMKIPWRRK